jgi:pimeloyl-[acyl-carrier protein] methyl ester esterase
MAAAHADRGYFGRENAPGFSDKAVRKIIMTHSFGLHWCPAGLLEEADHLVIVSGFISFHPEEPGERRRSKLFLRQMKSRFVEKPAEVLRMFYENVYHPEEVPVAVPAGCDHDRLLEDLENRVFNLDFANNLKHLVQYYVG